MAHKKHMAHGGRTVESPHSPQHYEGIETPPFKHPMEGSTPFHGSHPDHYAPHNGHGGHVHKHLHGK